MRDENQTQVSRAYLHMVNNMMATGTNVPANVAPRRVTRHSESTAALALVAHAVGGERAQACPSGLAGRDQRCNLEAVLHFS